MNSDRVIVYLQKYYSDYMQRKLLYVIISVALLSVGWLGVSGFTTLVGLVPLLCISASYGPSAKDWWRMAGWAALTFVLWNIATVWWVWVATPIGPIAATIVSTFWNMVAFMLFHYVSKRASKVLSYTILVAAWVATEFLYTYTEVLSFPWLTLGNAFSREVWAVQWYEFTGVMGGSLWVLLSNVAIYEALQSKQRGAIVRATAVVVVPIVVSLIIYATYEPSQQSVKVSVVQPNVDCYEEKFVDSAQKQMDNLLSLVSQAPSDSEIIALPETALPVQLDAENPNASPMVVQLHRTLDKMESQAMFVTGASTYKIYRDDEVPSVTARRSFEFYYDNYNSAIALRTLEESVVHHKMRLVVGVEAMPFPGLIKKFVDLGGVAGQLGRNDKATVFTSGDLTTAAAICYEGLYGEWFARFVREGSKVMLVLSNDGWWGDTPGYKRLFDFCRLRAIESRRAIGRSANTGISGFITPRGDVGQTLGWDEQGVLTSEIEVREDTTLYVRYGDWVGRLALFVTVLGMLYYSAYRVRRKNHLVD